MKTKKIEEGHSAAFSLPIHVKKKSSAISVGDNNRTQIRGILKFNWFVFLL